MTPPLFDRAMTAEEQRGFRMACACMVTWGGQIAAQGFALGTSPEPITQVRLMQANGQFLANCARALDLTVGQSTGGLGRGVRPAFGP
jgi:hypothetical protein